MNKYFLTLDEVKELFRNVFGVDAGRALELFMRWNPRTIHAYVSLDPVYYTNNIQIFYDAYHKYDIKNHIFPWEKIEATYEK